MRLDIDMIAEAFEATGLRPVRNTFGDGSSGCGMQAVALHRGVFYNSIRKLTGRPYFEGFTRAWDGHAERGVGDMQRLYGIPGMFEHCDGYADGKAAAEAMFAKAEEGVRSEELVLA